VVSADAPVFYEIRGGQLEKIIGKRQRIAIA
jgi:hypothetical protein